MKHIKFLLSLFLTTLLGVGQMWATDVSFAKSDFAWTGTTGAGNPVSATKDGITITCSKANIPTGGYIVF